MRKVLYNIIGIACGLIAMVLVNALLVHFYDSKQEEAEFADLQQKPLSFFAPMI